MTGVAACALCNAPKSNEVPMMALDNVRIMSFLSFVFFFLKQLTIGFSCNHFMLVFIELNVKKTIEYIRMMKPEN